MGLHPQWQKIEPGIWLISKAPRTYWIEAGCDNGKRKRRKRINGDIHEARRWKQKLWYQLKKRSLKSSGQYTKLWKALGYYILKKYSRKKQYRIGSGKAIMRLWMHEVGQLKPSELRNTHINQVIQNLQAAGYKNSAVIPYVSRLKTALHFARQAGKISLSSDVFNDLIKLKVEALPKLSIKDCDIDTIFKGLPDYGKAVVMYKRFIPCRLLEMYDALTETISIEKRSFWFMDTKNIPREMPIPEIMLPYFIHRKGSGSRWIFPREELLEDGTTIFHQVSRNHLTHLFSKERDKQGLDKRIKLRLLRHATVRKWLREFDDGIVGAVAGASAETLKAHYDMVEIESKIAAANTFALHNGHLMDTKCNILEFKPKSQAVSA